MRLNMNVWQAEAVAKAMREHDTAYTDQDLSHAYANVEIVEVNDDSNNRIVVIRWEDDAYKVLGDSYANEFTDQTEHYEEVPR